MDIKNNAANYKEISSVNDEFQSTVQKAQKEIQIKLESYAENIDKKTANSSANADDVKDQNEKTNFRRILSKVKREEKAEEHARKAGKNNIIVYSVEDPKFDNEEKKEEMGLQFFKTTFC